MRRKLTISCRVMIIGFQIWPLYAERVTGQRAAGRVAGLVKLDGRDVRGRLSAILDYSRYERPLKRHRILKMRPVRGSSGMWARVELNDLVRIALRAVSGRQGGAVGPWMRR